MRKMRWRVSLVIVFAAAVFAMVRLYGWPARMLPIGAPSDAQELVPVERVIDGDTIVVRYQGADTRVRLIGINTPETVDPRKSVECFGPEASAEAKKLLDGRTVRIETDPSQDTHDAYGRLLAYVWRDDGLFFNEYMVAHGYAYEYTFHTAYRYRDDFVAAQREAQTKSLGLWKRGVCDTHL